MIITKEYFLSTVADHKMTIEQDNGVFRCIEFEKPGTNVHYFRLTTFPGHLVITGDGGCYVFRRIYDMFDFFRSSELEINLDCWAEKVDAEDRRSSIRVYSEDLARKMLSEDFDNWREENDIQDLPEDDSYDFEQVFDACETEEGFRSLGTVELSCGYTCETRDFHPYEFSPAFIWCLHAIVWGIQQYDEFKNEVKYDV